MAGFQDTLTDFVNDGVPAVINNSTSIFNIIITCVLLVIAFLWLYCGVIIFIDSKRRFRFSSIIPNLILLVVGALLGPVGLIIYYVVRPRKSADELDFVKVEHKFYYHQASKVVDCLNCGAYVLEDHLYCTNCGTQNRFKCENCGTVTDYDDLYCHSCGKSFEGRYEKILDDLKLEDTELEDRKEEKNIKKDEAKNTEQETSKVKVFDKLSKIVDKFDQLVKRAFAKVKSLFSRKSSSDSSSN